MVRAKTFRHPAAGFTLIELLVVVAIIALLISILLPSLARSRAQAQGVLCMSHLRELSRATFYYAEDWKGVLPHYDYWLWSRNVVGGQIVDPIPESGALFGYAKSTAKYVAKKGACRNYVKSAEVFRCPMDRGQRKTVGGLTPIMPPTFSYTRNSYVCSLLKTLKLVSVEYYIPLSRPKRPAATPLYVEEYEFAPMNDGYFMESDFDSLTLRHNGRAMIAYNDTHVAPLPSQEFNERAWSFVAPSSTVPYRHNVLAPGYRKPK